MLPPTVIMLGGEQDLVCFGPVSGRPGVPLLPKCWQGPVHKHRSIQVFFDDNIDLDDPRSFLLERKLCYISPPTWVTRAFPGASKGPLGIVLPGMPGSLLPGPL